MSAKFAGVNNSIGDGVYPTLSSLVSAPELSSGSVVIVSEQENRGTYFITAIDEGGGVLLNNGLYANLYGGGTVLPELAPDLNFVSSRITSAFLFKEITGINAVGALTTALSLTGKFSISYLAFSGVVANDVSRVKLTVDGEIKWDSTLTTNIVGTVSLVGGVAGTVTTPENYMCNDSLLLEVQTITDTDISVRYLVRPIL